MMPDWESGAIVTRIHKPDNLDPFLRGYASNQVVGVRANAPISTVAPKAP